MHRTRLGDLLVEEGADQALVDAAMSEYYGRVAGKSGEHCLARNACTAGQLNRALARQAKEREDFDEAGKYIATNLSDTHKEALEHLDQARTLIAQMIAQKGGG
jgi:hypothetical protein